MMPFSVDLFERDMICVAVFAPSANARGQRMMASLRQRDRGGGATRALARPQTTTDDPGRGRGGTAARRRIVLASGRPGY